MKPSPKAVDPAQLHQLAHAVIREAKFPMLATVDTTGQPRVRPVSPVRVDENFTVYIANLRSYQKTREIATNPKVELAYLASNHDQVRITGTAELVTEHQLINAIWEKNPLLQQYLGSAENPEFLLYRIVPARIRFMREWALEYFELPIKKGAVHVEE